MDMQEPEEQQLEDEPVELTEDVNEPSDEPALSDSGVSEPDEEPAPDTLTMGETEKNPVDEDPGELASDVSSSDDTDAELESSMTEDTETEPAKEKQVGESHQDAPVEGEEASIELKSEEDSPIVASVIDDVDTVSAEEMTEPASEPDDPSAWFVVHCYSGYENKVRHNLEQRIETMGMKDMIFDVIIPTQEEIEVRDGKRRTVERHIFPGYVLVNMILTEESWYVVRNTPGVTGFVGMGNNPTPLRPEEVSQIVKRMEADAPTVKVTFKVGERVRIVDGPFNDFRGMVAEIDMERTKVRVMVSFFGRETPVELDFLQVEKA